MTLAITWDVKHKTKQTTITVYLMSYFSVSVVIPIFQKHTCIHSSCPTKIQLPFKYYMEKNYLSHDVASGSEITPCNKSVNH